MNKRKYAIVTDDGREKKRLLEVAKTHVFEPGEPPLTLDPFESFCYWDKEIRRQCPTKITGFLNIMCSQV